MPKRNMQLWVKDLQGPYVAAGVGFEPATLQTEGTEPTTESPRPTTLENAFSTYQEMDPLFVFS